MKRIGIFCIILLGLITIQTAQAMTVKDSLVQVLDTIPANKTRLNVLYLLAYQDPMSPSCLNYLDRLLKEAAVQEDIEYQCLAMYAYVVYYFNHQDGKNTKLWMDKLTEISLKHKYYNTYFSAKRAEILMHIIEHKIEYSITQAEEMYRLASQTNNTQGMRYAKLCLMNAYLMSARYKEGENAGFEAYRLLPATASLEERKDILQEISLACASIESEESLKYLKEFEIVLDKMSRQEAKFKLRIHHTSYLLLETLYANYYLQNGHIDEARIHLKKMNEYFSPTDYIPCRGLYYDVYAQYYRITQMYDKALIYADSAINLLSGVSDNNGLDYRIKRAGILADAGRTDEAIPLLRNLLAKKDTFYQHLSTSQMEEIYEMKKIDELLLEKEKHRSIIQTIELALITIALIILIPATIRIFYVKKRLKKEEEEIKKMTQIAEEANEVKSHFLSNMSYDIRSTLNNVLGFSQLMTQDPNSIETAQWKEYSEIVQTNSTELIQLVNDILDLSRLEAGKTKWQVQEYDIIPLCSDIVSIAQMRNKGKIQIDFKTTIKEQASQLDITRFTQVIVSTLIYPVPCDLQRHVTFSLYCNEQEKLLVFRIINTPLADAEFQIRKTDVRHRINRLTIEYFGGTYTVISNLKEEPTIIITYPYSKSAAEDAVRDNFHRQIRL
ncbi:histidine kinase [Bacteroides xylanisolvens]|jgi:signal transduction histidine kinase|uniref:histidine kinase n=2 Tax=Bacteroides TaxID=816 RepID=A0A4Q5DC03_9BACE|nr:histidine kinase [Bacteroides xylanisolvens]RGD50491.1 histidine kinase [Bacteroides sp. AM16-13]KAB6092781.1 histidine kinase [Bacteroides xylanisolvens]KAB6095237.1 histidine kinase [Bacteroides xylanisolvens]KAB6111460.1 histidine kinase [Bacteroides xylanisolvens]